MKSPQRQETGSELANADQATPTLVALTVCAAVISVVIVVVAAVMLLRRLRRRIPCNDRRRTPLPVQVIEMSPIVAQPEPCHSKFSLGQCMPSPVNRVPYDGYMSTYQQQGQEDSTVLIHQQV